MVLVLAASLDQARTVFEYIKGFFEASPTLSREVVNIKRNEIELANGVLIACHANSFRTVRGRTLLACIFDEVAFWRDDTSSTPDIETYRAVLPAMATVDGLLVGISTPYRKIGLLHQKHKDSYGVDDPDCLVVQGSSKQFNPCLSDAVIANQRTADPTSASSEWDAEFRTDISAYLDDEVLEQAIDHSRPLELAPDPRQWYQALVDPAGGGQSITADAYAIAIGHRSDDGHFVIDVCRGTRGKYDPQQITAEYAALCREYNIGTVYGDAYAAQWVAGSWQGENIVYEKSELPKSQLYLECLPLFSRGLVRLPNHQTLLKEFRLLERHTHRSGKDSVDQGRNGHDDHSNACAGVLRNLSNYLGYLPMSSWLGDDERQDGRVFQAQRLYAQLQGQINLYNTPTNFGRRLW